MSKHKFPVGAVVVMQLTGGVSPGEITEHTEIMGQATYSVKMPEGDTITHVSESQILAALSQEAPTVEGTVDVPRSPATLKEAILMVAEYLEVADQNVGHVQMKLPAKNANARALQTAWDSVRAAKELVKAVAISLQEAEDYTHGRN